MLDTQLIEIVVLALIAGVILFRLYTVLGRRTGHEPPPQESFRLSGNAPVDGPKDNVVALPQPSPVTLRVARAAKVIGMPVTQADCERVFARLLVGREIKAASPANRAFGEARHQRTLRRLPLRTVLREILCNFLR